jgi:hypothetical protein
MKTAKSILDEFGNKLIKDLQDKLVEKGVEYDEQASKLAASMKLRYSSGVLQMNVVMNDYWRVLNDGRGAGKSMPPIEPIKNWIKRKGIFLGISLKTKRKIGSVEKSKRKVLKKKTYDEKLTSTAFAISKSIGKKGFDGNHFFDEVLKDGRLEKLNKDILEATGKEVRTILTLK